MGEVMGTGSFAGKTGQQFPCGARYAATFAPMRHLLFLLTLALYGSSAMELHEWVRVPQVVMHLLEHHSDLGHHDEEGAGHHTDELPGEAHDHSPFDEGCAHEFCACGGLALLPMRSVMAWMPPMSGSELRTAEVEAYIASYSGSKWNPPKHG
jgi:hypothetical protein